MPNTCWWLRSRRYSRTCTCPRAACGSRTTSRKLPSRSCRSCHANGLPSLNGVSPAMMMTKELEELTRLLAVAVDVVTTEENIRLVAIGNLREPSEWFTGRRIAKVLLVDGRGVAPSQNMIASLSADGDRFLQALLEICALSGVAGSVDGIVMHCTSVPCRA
jgi:hypothetical protein